MSDNYKIWWDEERRIARAKLVGHLDEAGAKLFAKATKDFKLRYGIVDWCFDLEKASSAPSSRVRKILAETMASVDTGRFLFCGASIVMQTIGNLLARISGKRNIYHFANKTEAFIWLKENSP